MRTAGVTALVRLTHRQYRNTIRDLLGVSEPVGGAFAPDARGGFVFDTSNAYGVDGRLGPQYRLAAEDLGRQVVEQGAAWEQVVGCSEPTPQCRDRFLEEFGLRAWRRPLARDELVKFRGLFDSAAANGAAGQLSPEAKGGFREGVRLVVEAFLQSPDFLYRIELGPNAPGRRWPLDFEIAARLSYFLYDSMPDQSLFDAARTGSLHTPQQIESTVRRMLAEPRVLAKLTVFHEQLWQFDRFARITPDASAFAHVPSELVARAHRSARLYVEEVLKTGGGLEELLLGKHVFVDRELAPLYGLAPSAQPGFVRAELAPSERAGLLMQVGFLASNAYSARTDPIHRGLFVIRNLLCRQIPDPPPGASQKPLPPGHAPIITTRDEVSVLTGQSFCPTCHREINPPGFAFEGFDALGQRRSEDSGVPVDTGGQMVLDGKVVTFSGASELVGLLARSQEAHRCYSRRFMEFAYGRPLSVQDEPTLLALSRQSLPMADIIVGLVARAEFHEGGLPVPIGADRTLTAAAAPQSEDSP